ncbi:hypothetical protein L873DRAFT_1802029 [Choiromyces venosus 120613-1]|uniref:Uncharacterized protein n=1 Tax=Choiromyces venosus 120613-1 TaxID=1336337 RepID=A0A3N4JW41_9PEZI|nr:hypothetical protein L873DRAFT_1802029 [Choiromyces venosus 120613-1]
MTAPHSNSSHLNIISPPTQPLNNPRATIINQTTALYYSTIGPPHQTHSSRSSSSPKSITKSQGRQKTSEGSRSRSNQIKSNQSSDSKQDKSRQYKTRQGMVFPG